MKTFFFHKMLIALAMPLTASVLCGALGDRQSVHIYQRSEPIFPRAALEAGLNEGEVRVALSIDPRGQLEEWLVVGYTHPSFGDAAVSALKQWTFDPMRLNGEAMGAQIDINFYFRATGVVVSVNVNSEVERLFAKMGLNASWPCTMKELDSIPTPINAVAPPYPEDLRKHGISGEVVVEFYIDKDGNVRMPAVTSADHLELGILAAGTVRDWKFEPPTCGGRRVLVKARQVFNFRNRS